MTIRLYYDDSYRIRFTGSVLEQRITGDRNAVILDRTAFYPTSGGQPHDTGTLGCARVVEVEEDASGSILHILDGPVPAGQVEGQVDWQRRFDHMQQHTGQHILSQAFLAAARAATIGFHLGKETSTIDLELEQPSAAIIHEAGDLAAKVVFEDRPVKILKVDRAGLSELGVRKESSREGEIRVIEVESFDRSPCGGTHVRRTGEIGLISILGFERYKGGTRVEFVCGWRAAWAFRTDHDLLKELGKHYSAHPSELLRLSEKLFQERAALAHENGRLRNQVLDLEAQELTGRAARSGRLLVVHAKFGDRTLESVKALAQKVAAHPRAVAIMAAVRGDSSQLAVARNAEAAGDCSAAIRQIAAALGGKGGGKPELAQAGGIPLSALDDWIGRLEAYFVDANRPGN